MALFESVGEFLKYLFWGLLLFFASVLFARDAAVTIIQGQADDRNKGPMAVLLGLFLILIIIGLFIGLIEKNWAIFKSAIVAIIITVNVHLCGWIVSSQLYGKDEIIKTKLKNLSSSFDLIIFIGGLFTYGVLRTLDAGHVLIHDQPVLINAYLN